MKAIDKQVGGGHYKLYKIQPIEFIVKNNIPFIEGCIIKYALRHRYKNGIEDLKKIKHYVDLLIELEYDDEKLQRGSRWPVPEREKEILEKTWESTYPYSSSDYCYRKKENGRYPSWGKTQEEI